MAQCSPNCASLCTTHCGDACDIGCSHTCNLNCFHTCEGECKYGCSQYCKDDCTSTCQDTCKDECTTTCKDSCDTKCTTTCKDTCSTCSNGCSNDCKTGCLTSCNTYCDNACTAQNKTNEIYNLGANIKIGNIIKLTDITEIKDAMDNELTRRSKSKPSGNSITSSIGSGITVSDISKLNTSIAVMNSGKQISVSVGNIVLKSNYDSAVSYIQSLMLEKVR